MRRHQAAISPVWRQLLGCDHVHVLAPSDPFISTLHRSNYGESTDLECELMRAADMTNRLHPPHITPIAHHDHPRISYLKLHLNFPRFDDDLPERYFISITHQLGNAGWRFPIPWEEGHLQIQGVGDINPIVSQHNTMRMRI